MPVISEPVASSCPEQGPGKAENRDELQYLDQIKHILERGHRKEDRTGTGTVSVFGMQARYSLRDQFPLLTTKRVFWKGVLEELLWFIKGCTNSKELSAKGVKIWDANGSREFLDKQGFSNREEGDLGPVYGFQWRHFGAEYKDTYTDYSGQGVDQLRNVIETIKNNPDDRRIIMCSWNPKVICKCNCCSPFCFWLLKQCSRSQLINRHGEPTSPGDFVHTLGDAHVYLNHTEPLKLQLQRTPRPFPKLKILRKVENIDDFTADDFLIEGYNPHPSIKMEMAV
uniref:Thymidylate synthase n=1 Tax=Xenopus tropicalis TaxID=8364 RepID=A0A6I8SNK4_XENTR